MATAMKLLLLPCLQSLSLSPTVYVCVTSLLRGMFPGSSNSEKDHINGIEHFLSNGISPVFLLLDLQFQGKTFWILFDLQIFRKWREIEQTLLLPSIGNHLFVIEVDICERCTKFSRSNILNINISETVTTSTKMCIMTLQTLILTHQIAHFVLHDLNLHFQSQTSGMLLSWKQWEIM